MAIYHFSGKIISRLRQSAVACAAYRSGQKLFDERAGKYKSYRRKVEPESFILLPENAPAWANDREKLWNEVEKIEKQYNSKLAREFNIALPIELSNKEQKELAKEYCQKAFVDKGMIADVSIHRDKNENPHFHVMLTIRPFSNDGTWWKTRTQKKYFLDENGEKIKENGRYKSYNQDLTGWENKQIFYEWRKLWEQYLNSYLIKNDVKEIVTAESNKSLKNGMIATVHEGYVARKLNNRNIYSYKIEENKKIKKINEITKEIKNLEKEKINEQLKIYRKFSPAEKKMLKDIANELHIYINANNIKKRVEQLKYWGKNIANINIDIDDLVFKQESRIVKENECLLKAQKILENESERFISYYYPNLNISIMNNIMKIRVVEETIANKKLFTKDELKDIFKKLYVEEIDEILNNNIDPKVIKLEIDKIQNEIKSICDKYHVDLSNKNTRNNLPELQLNILKNNLFKSKEKKEHLKKLEKIYDIKIGLLYPEIDINKLNVIQKYMISSNSKYFGRYLTLDELMNKVPQKYSTEEQKVMVQKILEHQEVFKNDDISLSWFLIECIKNDELDIELKKKIVDIQKKDRKGKYNMKTFDSSCDIYVFGSISSLLENEFENEKAKHRLEYEQSKNKHRR